MWTSALLWFKPKEKKSKNGIKLPHAKVYDLREEETRSTCASESHFWTGRDVMRSKSKSSSRVHQWLRKHSVILWGLWKRTHKEMISETSGVGRSVSAVWLNRRIHILCLFSFEKFHSSQEPLRHCCILVSMGIDHWGARASSSR